MSFIWEKGYGTHACRDLLTYTKFRNLNMDITLDLLKSWGYICESKEVKKYLKIYPITKSELLKEEEIHSDLTRLLGGEYALCVQKIMGKSAKVSQRA